MFKKVLILFSFIQILFASCNNNEGNREDIIIHGIFSELSTLDPSKISNTVSYQIFPLLFETLVTLENNYNIKPQLAKSWEKSDDGLSYYFHLRHDVKFHDGKYLTAQDVKISFIRQFDTKCPYYYDNPPNIFKKLLEEMISSIDIIDSVNVKFNLKYPSSVFLYLLSSPRVSPIVSSKSLNMISESFIICPIGTGSFKLNKKTEEGDIILTRFEKYWDKIPNIRELYFKLCPQSELEEQALSNLIDVLPRIRGNIVERFKSSNNFIFISTKTETIYFLGFNLKKNIIKNKNFREAILLSLDRQKIVSTINRTNAIMADGPLPRGIFYSENLARQKDHDTEKAKKIIKELGNNIPKLKIIGFEDSPRTRIFFDIIVNYLNKVGIKIEKNYYSKWEEFLSAREFDDFDLTLEGWGADILGDPYFFLYNLFHSNSYFNVFRYKNEKIDKLLEDAVRTFDKDKRHKMYEEINNIIIEDIPAVFISQIKDVFVVNKKIKNVIINPYRYVEYNKVIID